MALGNEGEGLTQREKVESTFKDKAVEEIMADLRGEELNSARFQAFADYADYVEANEQVRSSPDNTLFLLKYSLIQETKRQRNNCLQGYKKAYREMEDLGSKLGKSMEMDKSRGKDAGSFSASLGYIKNTIIIEKAQQS